ncbi:TetR/AcrR family transcriptional regulator [Ferrovibrio sp.]|uniref:TetR/AcrR family transcriptional regulator n=1 Tax=Ferrovibrio sp. TaxID=1917215 RepID=UPI0035AE11BB
MKRPTSSRKASASPPRGRPKRSAELIEARRSQICAAAIERFSRDGYHTTTMQSIADDAGMSVGLIYSYFRDKEDLLIYAMNDVLDAYVREVPIAIASKTNPLDQFIAAVHGFGRVVDERRPAWLIGYRESHMLSPEARREILQKDVATTKLIEDRIRACIKAELFHPIDTQMLTYQSLLLVHGWALAAWRLPRMTCRRYIDRGLSILLKPILVDGNYPQIDWNEQ